MVSLMEDIRYVQNYKGYNAWGLYIDFNLNLISFLLSYNCGIISKSTALFTYVKDKKADIKKRNLSF